jgi:hypothetical protein
MSHSANTVCDSTTGTLQKKNVWHYDVKLCTNYYYKMKVNYRAKSKACVTNK